MISPDLLHSIATELTEAEKHRTPVAPLTTRYSNLTVSDAYQIQCTTAAKRMREQGRLVGYKVGLTSREAQKHFGLTEPDFGHLFSDMLIPEEQEIPLNRLIQPKIEGEIAFVLGQDLKGPGITIVDAIRAVEFALVSMEIVDSRIENWKIKAADTIADNGSSSRFVLGSKKVKLEDIDLKEVGMALSRNGEVAVTGAGSAVLGNPLLAVVFLANELGKHGRGLTAGEVILSGSLGGMIPIKAEDAYECEMLGLGRVAVRTGKEI